MKRWRQWAEHALGVMNRRGLLDPSERRALMAVRDSGDEPYHTLKRYVLSLGGLPPRRVWKDRSETKRKKED